MIRDLSKRGVLFFGLAIVLVACSGGSGSGSEPPTTVPEPTSTTLAQTTTTIQPTTTTVFYNYPEQATIDFVDGCIQVGGDRSQCECVVIAAQYLMPPEEFGVLVNPELTDWEPTPALESLVAECR